MNIREYFFTPLLKENYLEFFKKREVITKSFLLITIATFITLWSIHVRDNVSSLTFWLIVFSSPIYCFTFYYGVYRFLFKYNWFYSIYFLSSLSLLSITMVKLNERFGYSPVVYELMFLLSIGIIGYAIALILSLPFKLLNHWLFNTNVVYYAPDLPDEIADELYGRDKIKKEQKLAKASASASKYDVMNETQLQIELQNALTDERFEEADLIKKALEKYR